MLSAEEYIIQSLEHNLFFLRIMKEHLIFAAASLTPKNYNLIQPVLDMKKQFEELLASTVLLANGAVTPPSTASCEFVTQYTLKAELMTQEYTGIPIDENITRMEMRLKANCSFRPILALENQVHMLNQQALTLVDNIIQLKEMVYKDVLTCRMFVHLYPLLLKHVIEEALFYRNVLQKLQRRESLDSINDIAANEIFWNEIMGEHAGFIRGMLDPTEELLIDKADKFAQIFAELEEEARLAASQEMLLAKTTGESLEATRALRDFKEQGTKGILECKIRSVILPLLADHVFREACHYCRMLNKFEREL